MLKSYNQTKYACFIGYSTQAINLNFPLLLFYIFQEESGIPFEQLGRLIRINFSVQIGSDI